MSVKENQDEKALQEFLLDIDCLNALNEWANKFNVFDILKITKTEIRHSNILSWLLSPRENHGLNDWVIRGLIEKIINNHDVESIDVFKILLMDFYDFVVFREWNSIDILLVSEKSKLVICIENKVDSGEHSNQLNRYRDILNKHYAEYEQICIFLTPNGDDASDIANWLSFSYSELMDIVENAMAKSKLSSEIEFIITNYIETVRWHIVGDERLINICNDIYTKHKRALDLIFEHRINGLSGVQKALKDAIKNYISDSPDMFFGKEGANYVLFYTKDLVNQFPLSKDRTSGWNTNYFISYEFTVRNNQARIILSLSRGDLTDDECVDIFGKFLANEKPQDNVTSWKWKRIKTYKLLSYTEDDSVEDIEEKIIHKIKEVMPKVLIDERKMLLKLK